MKRTMRWAACAALLLAGAGSVSAQNLRLQPVGEVVRTGGERIYSIPSPTLVVELTVQKETVVTGPYARFAQKYFGVIAPLADKENYTIVAAAVRAEDTGRPALRRETAADDRPAPAPADRPRPQEERGALSRLQPDRMSMESQSLESAAQKAAEAIFYMRSRRAELVLGDYAETVYGAGLQTAVERIDRMEREYLELFFGTQRTETYWVTFRVVPDAATTTSVVCRFRPDAGVLPNDDLSGEPVLLECRPQGVAAQAYPTDPKAGKIKGGREYAVPDLTDCRVSYGREVLCNVVEPIYQYGVKTVVAPEDKSF